MGEIKIPLDSQRPDAMVKTITSGFRNPTGAPPDNIRPFYNRPSNEQLREYLRAAEQFRNGETPGRVISWPDNHPAFKFVSEFYDSVDNMTHLMFYHPEVACVATNSGDRQFDVIHYNNPPMFFVVSINRGTGAASLKSVKSPFTVGGRAYPHDGMGYDVLLGSPCFGDNGDAIIAALAISDLGMLLDLMHVVITTATNYNDPWGASCRDFNIRAYDNDQQPCRFTLRQNANVEMAGFMEGMIEKAIETGKVRRAPRFLMSYRITNDMRRTYQCAFDRGYATEDIPPSLIEGPYMDSNGEEVDVWGVPLTVA